MMISPEAYYEFELKGKTAAEIEEEIRILKKEISDLKYKMEDPDYRPEMICPSDDTVLYWTREYLARAKMALAEAGGSYAETDEDRHAAEFLKNLPFLAGISFQCGGCFEPQIPLTVECKTEALKWSRESFVCKMGSDDQPKTRKELLKQIRELHLEEWQAEYWPDKYGINVLDGIQWELKLEYSNSHGPWTAFGSNAYPYNFRELLSLLGEYNWLDSEYEEDDASDEE